MSFYVQLGGLCLAKYVYANEASNEPNQGRATLSQFPSSLVGTGREAGSQWWSTLHTTV